MDGLPYYRVRLGRRIIQCELEELLELAAQARIQPATLIIPPFSQSWQAADSLIELSGRLSSTPPPPAPGKAPADPWSAWEEMAEDGPADDLGSGGSIDGRAASAAEPTEDWEDEAATEMGLSPLSPSAPGRLEPLLLPEASIVPLEVEAEPPPHKARPPGEAAPRPLGASNPRGKIIAFPRERSRRDVEVEGPYALAAQDFPVFHPPPPRPPPPTSPMVAGLRYSVNGGRLVALVGAGLAVLAVAWFYVQDTANATFPPHPASANLGPPPPPAPTPAGAPGGGPGSGPAVADPYKELEAELRSRMSVDLLDVHEEGDLTDAMYLELARVKVDVKTARAEVTAWGGRKQDEPEAAEFRIQVRSNPERIDRDLGGTALIVGKYIQRYNLKVSHLEVYLEDPDGRTSRWSLDPEAARSFYVQRTSLMQLLRQTLEAGSAPR